MKLRDKILSQRLPKENKLYIINKTKKEEEIKKDFISKCDKVIEEIRQYITENIKFFEELKNKIIQELTDNDTYFFSLDSYIEETSLEEPFLYSFVGEFSCLKDKKPEAIQKIKFDEKYKISLGYSNNLPYGEDFIVFLYDTFDLYDIYFRDTLISCPDSVYSSNYLKISLNKEKLIDYLNEQGLTVYTLGENGIKVGI